MALTIKDPVLEVVKWSLSAMVGAFISLVTVGTFSPHDSVFLFLATMGVLMACATALHSERFSRAADKLHMVEESLGRPAKFYPKQLNTDDGAYFTEIAEHIRRTAPGETIWIVTSHLSTPRGARNDLVKAARDKFHEALVDRAAHGVHVRRVFTFMDAVSFDAIDPHYLSRHTTDHCKRLLEIAKSQPHAVSLRASREFTGTDFLVIPGRIAVLTADVLDKDRLLKHVLCWMFFNPPNHEVIETIREWCEGVDNNADIIRNLPDGLPDTALPSKV